MEKAIFEQQIEKAQRRLDELEQAAQIKGGENELLLEALAELSTALAELGVSGEELNQQNEALAEARQQIEAERSHYKELFELTPDGYLVTDVNATIREANRAAGALLGVRREFLIGKPLVVFITEDEHEKFLSWLTQAGKSEMANQELTIQPRGGKPFPVELTVNAIYQHGKQTGLRWLIHNITRRKQVEAALRNSETEKTMILDGASDMIAYYDLDLRVVWVNAASGASVGEPPAALIGRHCYEIWHHRESACEGCPILLARDTRRPAEYELSTPEGKVFYLHGYPVLDEAGEVKALIEFRQDITQRTMAEAALRESEELFHTLATLAPVGIFLSDPQGKCTYANPRWLQMVGLTLEEVLGDGWMVAIYSEDRQRVIDQWSQYCRNPEIWDEEYRLQTPRGQVTWVSGIAAPMVDSRGQRTGFVDIDTDISEYKRVVESLQRSEKRYRGLFMESPVSLWEEDFSAVRMQIDQLRAAGVTDLRRYFELHPEAVGQFAAMIKVVDVNQATLNLYKASSKAQLKQNLDKVFTVESYNLIREEVIDLFEGKKQITREGFNRNLEGEKIFLEIGISVAPGYEDTWSKMLISIVDITERRQAEDALRKSEAFLNSIIEQSPLAMWISDDQGNLIRINQACCEMLNIREEEVLGVYNVLNDNIIEEQGYLPLIKRVFERGEPVRFELSYDVSELQNPNLQGRANVILDVTIFPIKDASGKVSNAIIQNINITERKQAERALNEERNFINAILDNAAILVNVLDREGHFVLVNKYFEQVTGYSASELEDRYIWDTTLPEDEAQVLKTYFNELWEGDFPKVINNRVLTRTGEQVPFEWINTLIADDQGKPRYSLGIGLGLTERQKMEVQLRASLAEKEVLLREVHHRVKNNLEVINSLAEMQLRKINDPQAIVSLRQLQERIRTIALVHENLYRSENLAEIRALPYLEKLTDNLFQAFGWPKLSLQTHTEDMIISLDQAVPFGLIVTELVTNGLKHAFPAETIKQTIRPDGGENRILVSMRLEGDQNILEVSDNGVGLPKDLDWRNAHSLGLRLVNRLTDQLHGSIEAFTDKGTTFRVTFPSQVYIV